MALRRQFTMNFKRFTMTITSTTICTTMYSNTCKKIKFLGLLLLVTSLGGTVLSKNALASDEHGKAEAHMDKGSAHDKDKHEAGHETEHEDEHETGHHEEEGHVEISIDDAANAGSINASASAGHIKNITTVYGRVVVKPDSISQVRARFPGLITKLNVNVGDVVKAGDTIVQVESSDSLRRYDITAPISGLISARHANAGELANQQPLLTIENYEQLWVEYNIFPSQQQVIEKKQQVTVSSASMTAQSSIMHLMANKNQPFMTAVVALDNSAGKWIPGQMLTGEVVTAHRSVALVIDNRALQEIEGKTVVFVTNQGGYETRELQLGDTDGQFSQVLSGLNAGEQYALINSYLLKADLGKAGASHAH